MLDISISMFFDKAPAMKALKDGVRKSLSKAGAFVRRTAMFSIRTRKASARPGNPPFSHVGLLKSLIWFGYDENSESVVIGPKLWKSSSPTVPELLEYGGSTIRKGKAAIYHKFPYMQPALEENVSKFPELFANSVRS